jgi:hypothetical protein
MNTAMARIPVPRRRLPRRAFTLVETITTITILATVVVLSSKIIYSAVDSYGAAATRAELHGRLSVALDRVCTALREIPLKGSLPAAPNITSISATSITWNTNYTLTLTGTSLMLTEAGGTARTLLDNVSSLALQSYDQSNAALGATLSGAGCDPIRRIQITLAVQKSGITETLRTRVFLRSLMQGGSP